jgi:hypothetical protein
VGEERSAPGEEDGEEGMKKEKREEGDGRRSAVGEGGKEWWGYRRRWKQDGGAPKAKATTRKKGYSSLSTRLL